ncbi:MAG: iron-containing alcohol dehydrogenase [Parvularculaceae bacterium]
MSARIFDFALPTAIRSGPGARNDVAEIIKSRGAKRPFLMLDSALNGHLECRALIDAIRAAHSDLGVELHPGGEPELSQAIDSGGRLAEHGADLIVALGGGSVIDLAKAAAYLQHHPDFQWGDGVAETVEGAATPLIAVPTTCGTGSEVSRSAVLGDKANRRKLSMRGAPMRPALAIVDPDLIATLPKNLVAWTGMDALTHAIEAHIARCATPVASLFAIEAMRLLFGNLEAAHADIAGDARAREAVMRAATLAGVAFSNSDVAGVHCLSETLGAFYGTPHGLGNAALLVPMLEYQREAAAPALARAARAVWPAETGGFDGERAAALLIARIRSLADALEIPSFSTLNIPPAEFSEIAEEAARNGSNPSNPREMGPADYRALLDALAAA